MSKSRVVKRDDARIKTTSVQIKALMIGNKQMTLSVFRQLPERKLFDIDGSLTGNVWGWVNYKWEKNSHLFFAYAVCEMNGELYRAKIPHLDDPDGEYSVEYVEDFLESFVYGTIDSDDDMEALCKNFGRFMNSATSIIAMNQLFIAV